MNGYKIFSTGRPELHIHTKSSENFFVSVSKEAQDVGLKVNPLKTQMLSISGNGADLVKTYFPIPRDAVTNGNGDTTTVSRCTNFDTF